MKCECMDRGCLEHRGGICHEDAAEDCTVFRVDMEDQDGTAMCAGCAGDALESGVFTMRDVE